MMIVRRILSSVAVVAIAATLTSCAPPKGNEVSGDDVDILETVLKGDCADLGDNRFHTVSDVPAKFDSPVGIPTSETVPVEQAAEITRRGQLGLKWPHIVPCDAQRLVDGDRVAALIAADKEVPPSWKGFFAAYPGAFDLTQVSLPALSSDGKLATVLLIEKLEYFSDSGFLVELERTSRGWRILRRRMLWIHSL
jgi:hypothetical protein